MLLPSRVFVVNFSKCLTFVMTGTFVTVIIAAVASSITYYLMRSAHLSVTDSVYVKMVPEEIFAYLKNPNNLPETHYKYQSVSVENVRQGEDGREFWHYTVIEDVPHIGPTSFYSKSMADPASSRIVVQNERLYGLVQHQVVYTLEESKDDEGNSGTIITERNDFNVPSGLWSFINKTTHSVQREVLNNLKTVLETGEAGKSWQNKYYEDDDYDEFNDEDDDT